MLELGLVVAALGCYLLVRWYAGGHVAAAVRNAAAVHDLERSLGISWEHGLQQAASARPWLSVPLTQFYVWGYFPLLIAVMVWLFVRHHDSYGRMRNALLASGAIGMLVYAFFPCAPPWYVAGEPDTAGSGPLAAVARPPGIANVLGAMPSFHCGWLVVAAVVVFRVTGSHAVRALCLLLPTLMAVTVVATGNHWVLDVPAGLLVAALGLSGAALVREPAAAPGRHRLRRRGQRLG